MIATPVVLAIPFFKWCFEVDREQFARTNAYGVREYGSYEEMRRDVNRETKAQLIARLLFLPGIASIVLGILMVVVSIESNGK